MYKDLGSKYHGAVLGDASAALGIMHRKGVGKLRHLSTNFLCVQERAARREIGYIKVKGSSNVADMLTKPLAQSDLQRHLGFANLMIAEGRADASLQVN